MCPRRELFGNKWCRNPGKCGLTGSRRKERRRSVRVESSETGDELSADCAVCARVQLYLVAFL